MNKVGKKNNNNFLKELRKELENSDLKELSLSLEDFDIPKLYKYKEERDFCNNCSSLENCNQPTKGYKPILDDYDIVSYRECKFMRQYKDNYKKENLAQTLYLPKKILTSNLKNFSQDTNQRKEVLRYAINFVTNYKKDNYIKGIYLDGVYGAGKTYLLAAIANELSKRNLESLLIYYPDLARDLKSSISNNTLEEKITKLKKVDILFLDDIGGEMNTEWLRDEILGPILQYRLLDELPTFFSSNIPINSLVNHLASTKTTKEDTIKANRIYERINNLTVKYTLSEKMFKEIK